VFFARRASQSRTLLASAKENRMTTKLEGQLKREIAIGDDAYTLTLAPEGFVLARKGRRKGLEIRWADLVKGEAALADGAQCIVDRAARKAERAKRNNR
jgi:hypothetical protein